MSALPVGSRWTIFSHQFNTKAITVHGRDVIGQELSHGHEAARVWIVGRDKDKNGNEFTTLKNEATKEFLVADRNNAYKITTSKTPADDGLWVVVEINGARRIHWSPSNKADLEYPASGADKVELRLGEFNAAGTQLWDFRAP